MEIVVNRLVVDFHKSQCSKNVAKSYIIPTASDFIDRRLATKMDRFRGEGSNPLVKLIRGRIRSASKNDPTD